MSLRVGLGFLSLSIVTACFGILPWLPAQVNKAWVATYDGPGTDRDVASAVSVDRQDNIVVAGVSNSGVLSAMFRYVTVKYDVTGVIQWELSHGDSAFEIEPPVLAIDAGGDIIVAGTSRRTEGLDTDTDFFTVKIAWYGEKLWERYYNGPDDAADTPSAVAIDQDGNVLVVGTSREPSTGFTDFVTVKYASDGTELWAREYDGAASGDDTPVGVAIDGAGNVFVAGTSFGGSATQSDYATVKYSSEGEELWVRRHDGAASGMDSVGAIAVDAAGNAYVTGASAGSGSVGTDCTTVKYSPDGRELWVRSYGGAGLGDDLPRAIALDPAGNVAIAGEATVRAEPSDVDYLTLKYSPEGEMLWVRLYGGPGGLRDGSKGIAVDAAGNVHVTGESQGKSSGDADLAYDYATVKYSSDGRQLWVHRYDGAVEGRDQPCGVVLDSLGNVVLAGRSDSAGGGCDYATLRLDPEGHPLWLDTHSAPGSEIERVTALALDRAGHVLVTGPSPNPEGATDFATIQYSPAGEELWVRRYDGPAGSNDAPVGLAIDGSGASFVVGPSTGIPDTQCDYALVKYGSDGAELWIRRYDGPEGLDDTPCAVAVDPDGNAVVTGESAGDLGTKFEFATVKYDPQGSELWVRRYGGNGETCRPRGLAIDASGNVFVAGECHVGDPVSSDIVTVKYAPDGRELWVKGFDGPGGRSDVPVGIAVDPAGNLHVAGESLRGDESGWDLAIVKYAPGGAELWSRQFDGSANGTNRCGGIAVDASGKVHVAGVSMGPPPQADWVTFAYDADGNELWVARHSEEPSGGQVPKCLILDAVGNVLVAGLLGASGMSDHAGTHTVLKYDPQGTMLWAVSQPAGISALVADAEGGVYVAGGLDDDFVTVKYESPALKRGLVDANDSLDITDAILLLQYLFLAGEVPACLDAADVDDSGTIELTDPIRILNHLFRGGPAPAEPYLECGRDLTLDGLECISSAACAFSGYPRFVLFGRELQADGVFFVVDRSGSMTDQGELALAKREISTAIAGFPETVEFGIVLFDTLVESYPSTGFPVMADPAAKLEAAGFIESMLPASGSCCLPGFVAGLEFAARSKAHRKALIYIGDGGGSCRGAHDEAYLRQALAKIEALNTHGVEIHCMAIRNVASIGDEFLRRLAWDNEGSYTVVPK